MNYLSPVALVIMLIVILPGCSSPPKPVPVDFNHEPVPVNSDLPNLVFSNKTFKSSRTEAPWSLTVHDFKGDNGAYDIAFYYAVAHAERIELVGSNPRNREMARQWLLRHGATAAIELKPEQAVSLPQICVQDVTSWGCSARAFSRPSEDESISMTLYNYGELKT